MTEPTPEQLAEKENQAAISTAIAHFEPVSAAAEALRELERDKQRLDKLDALIGPHQNAFNSVELFEEDGGLILMMAGLDAIVGANIREVLDQLP